MQKTLIMMLIVCGTLLGHGVDHNQLSGGTGIQFHYANGEPLSDSDIQLFRPGENELEFQIGSTDAKGVFMFLPDTTGPWTIKVSDGLGHGKVVTIDIAAVTDPAAAPGELPTWKRVVSSLGYLLFIFALWGMIAMRRRA